VTKAAPALVFSDLDGTLLDHETYRYGEALPALKALKKADVPLILASSKTAAEMAPIRAELGFENCEAIVENGGGILEPFAVAPEASRTYPHLLSAMNRVSPELRNLFAGFSQWSAKEVAARTGLDMASAKKARQRDFSEPGIWSGNDDELARFIAALAEMDISAVRGGRFLTLSFGGTKARRMIELCGRYQTGELERPPTLALGDAPNDAEMLIAADFAAIIPNPANGAKIEIGDEAKGEVALASSPGPAGWNECVLQFLGRQGLL